MSMSPCPCLHVYVYMSMSACPCLHVMSPYPCLHAFMSLFLHVSMPYAYVSMFPFSIFMSPFLYVSMFTCPCLHVSGIRKRKTELTQNSSFRLFATNRNGERKFVFHGLQTINGNQRLLLQQTFPSTVTRYISTRVSTHICFNVTVPNL
jgi:hypothetical protein